MRQPLTDEDLRERSVIDGRVAFAVTVFIASAALVALLDRVGVAERIVELLGPLITLAGLCLLGLLLRTMRVSRFYAGGRAVPAAYASLATAAIAAGLVIPFLPPVSGAVSPAGLVIGFGGGLALAALVISPFLRKTGAFSATDLIAGRFPNLPLRFGVVTVVSAIGLLVGLAGLASAAATFSTGLGVSHSVSLSVLAAALVLMTAPGGVCGSIWGAASAMGVLLAGLILPLLMALGHGERIVVPILDGGPWRTAVDLMAGWQGAAATATSASGMALIVALLLGVGTLAPLLSPGIVVSDHTSARRAGAGAVAWSAILALVLGTTMAMTALGLQHGLVGLKPVDVPDYAISASVSGQISLCRAAPASLRAAMSACAATPGFTGVIRAQDVSAGGAFLVQGLSATLGLGRAFSGLAIAGLTAVALSLAAAGFQVMATALGHDGYYRIRNATAMTSRRLAITRALLVLAIAASAALLDRATPDERMLLGLAVALSASAIAPMLALSLWPRAESADATLTLLVGLASAEAVIFFYNGAPALEILALASVLASTLGFLAGFGASLLRQANPTSNGGAFVHGVLHGETDLVNPDKGA